MSGIGERLKEVRLRNGWSQKDLAGESKTNVDTISGIETGQHEPRPSTLRKLARALGIEVRELFEDPTLLGKHPKITAAQAVFYYRDDESFLRAIAVEDPENLRTLIRDLVSEYLPQRREDLGNPRSSVEDTTLRIKAFARAYMAVEELRRRGEKAPENDVLAMRRWVDVVFTLDPRLAHESREAG